MIFEYDPAKSAANAQKHGIDFEKIQAIWLDPQVLEIKARTTDEPRWVVIGRIQGKYWSVIITYREDRIRIISARRSRKEEITLYETY